MALPVPDDDLRERLLDAAARVFARKGYTGTKIQDIVRESGLSTGAAYARFESKEELLRQAVVSRSIRATAPGDSTWERVADLIRQIAAVSDAPLSDVEAVRLEAFVTARREPEVAAALAEAQQQWRVAVAPLVDAAMADGTVATDVDPEAVLFLVRTLSLGLLLQRGAGIPLPEPQSWDDLIGRIVASFGSDGTSRA